MEFLEKKFQEQGYTYNPTIKNQISAVTEFNFDEDIDTLKIVVSYDIDYKIIRSKKAKAIKVITTARTKKGVNINCSTLKYGVNFVFLNLKTYHKNADKGDIKSWIIIPESVGDCKDIKVNNVEVDRAK